MGTICALGFPLYEAIDSAETDSFYKSKHPNKGLHSETSFWKEQAFLLIILIPAVGVGALGWIINAIFL